MRDSLASFWWESVTGPATVVGNIVALLGEAHCVALRRPCHMPWEDRFRDAVIEKLRRQQSTRGLLIEVVEDGRLTSPEDVLPSYALDGEALSWRPHRESLAAFLSRTRALQGLLIWVRNLDADSARKWAEVCSNIKQASAADGVILLECPDMHFAGVSEVRYASLVSEYASRLLCSTIADSTLPPSSTDARKDYTAALLSRLCEGDVELAVSLSEVYRPGYDEPLDVMVRLNEGMDKQGMDKPSEKWYMHIWEAQLECLFPILESERLRIVDRHADQLDVLCAEGLTDALDEPIGSRYDIEIGTLYWLSHDGCPNIMRLRNCDENEQARIGILRDCRNSLAHRHIVGEEITRQIVD